MSTPAAEKERVFLEADDEIRGQKFVCLSFLSPDKGIIRNKNLWMFSKFLEYYAMDYKVKATESFVLGQLRDMQNLLSEVEMVVENLKVDADLKEKLASAEASDALSSKCSDVVERITKMRGTFSAKTASDIDAHVKANLQDFKESSIVEEYEKYMLVNRQRLEDEFSKASNFQTTVHGLKVRGVYSTHEQACARAKALAKKDPIFNIYVAEVGEWLPWDPNPDDVQEGEYANEELNKLMKAYKEQAAKKDAFFEEDKRQKLADAHAAAAAAKKSATTETAGDDIFDGPGDLAIQRKAEAASTATAVAAAASDDAISHA
jgi:hypothetical protein